MSVAVVSSSSLPLSFVNALDIGKRFRGAAIGLLFYDHVINLDREIQLVWSKSKRRPGFYLYIFNRFFAFGYYVWNTIPLTSDGTNTAMNCAIFLTCDGIVTMLATVVVQIILQLRIYALYGRSRRILIFLLAFCALEVIAMAMLVTVTMMDLRILPIESTNTGCAYQGLFKTSALFWLPGLIFEPVLFALVAYKAWMERPQDSQGRLVKQIAKDSLLYFAAIFAELLLSTIIWARASEYINIVNPWAAALPSLLGSRLLLNMREITETQCDGSYILEMYTVNAAGERFVIRSGDG